jgi:tetratricopeptide (TPR) repeat protein
MRNRLAVLFCAVLAACAGPQALTQRPEQLFRDDLFAPPSVRIDAADVFALSPAMRQYLDGEIAAQWRRKGAIRGLIDALYEKGGLKIDYDSGRTRDARQAFAERSGNCLSLVIMTAAFAKELGLQVHFQSAYLEETFARNSNLLLRSGHVNIALGRSFANARNGPYENPLTIDFLPPEELRGLRVREISEETVVAMFMNNRAVEALVDERLDDAYWWAREAIRSDPLFLGAPNTLGIVYLRRGHLPQAAEAFVRVLDLDADNKPALSNLARTYARQGRMQDSRILYERLARLEPDPPYSFFNRGLAAMKTQNFDAARDLFAKEVARADYRSEFHYWLGIANLRLGDIERARKHLKLAVENSTSQKERELYSAKLEWMRSRGVR